MEQILLNNTLPNQEITFDVDTKFITLRLRTTNNGLYADLSIEDEQIFYGRRCIDRIPLFINPNIIKGNLYFKDLYGNENPRYEEFNERFILVYDPNYIIL